MKKTIKILSFSFTCLLLMAFLSHNSYAQVSSKGKDLKLETLKLKADVSCNNCKSKIEKALAYEKGVKESNASVESKIVTVTYNPEKTNPEKIEKVIDKLGYNASVMNSKHNCADKKADCKTKKSSCCKKRTIQ